MSVPEAAGRIHYIPHGAPTPFLAASPLQRPAEPPADIAHLPRPLLGYIGSMEDRVDWELMDRISRELPRASIVVIGRIREPSDEPWWEACARFLGRPNVHAIGWRKQEDLARYYQSFDVTLIPYQLDHPFNRACNPTKIMDTMGSGRPIVATAHPRVPAARRAVPRRRGCRRLHGGHSSDPRPSVGRRPGLAPSFLRPRQYLS